MEGPTEHRESSLFRDPTQRVEKRGALSSPVHDQFRAEIAASVTRQYVAQSGTQLNAGFFNRCIKMIDDLASRPDYYRDYLEAVRPHRYVNEEDEVEVT